MWSAIVTVAALSVLVVVLWRILDVREDAHVERAVSMAANGAAQLLEKDINGRVADLGRMARRWHAHDGLSRQEWEDDITTYMSDHPGFRAIAWVDETDKVRWVMPWEGTEKSHGIYLGFDPERRRVLDRAREQRRSVLSKIIQLLDGQEGFLALVPLEDTSGFVGNLVAVFEVQKWLDTVFGNFPVAGIYLSVIDDGRNIYPRNIQGRLHTDGPTVESEVRLYDHRWSLRAAPTPELEAEIRSPHPPIVLVGGLVLAVITGVTVGLGTLARRRAERLSALNKELTQRIHAQEEAENSLKEREAHFELLAQASPSMIFLSDANGEIICVNEQFQRITGLAEDSWVGDRWVNSTHPDDRERVYRRWKRTVEEGAAWQEEYRVRRPDGRTIWLLELAVPIRDDTGNITGYIGTGTEITARKHAEQDAERLRSELAHAVRVTSLGEMATGLAHEVNQPLAAITNYCELAKDMIQAEDGLPKDLGYALDQAVVQAHRAGDIVQNIRNFLRQGEPELSRIELAAVAREALSVIKPEAHDKGANIELRMEEDLPSISGNRLQLVQVLVNLMLNSIEAMTLAGSRRKEIIVTATDAAENILVTVQDTGPGVDPIREKNLFDAFATGKPDGMGMGLAICRTLVEAHGGNIRAGSGKAGGAEFIFTLPVAIDGEQR